MISAAPARPWTPRLLLAIALAAPSAALGQSSGAGAPFGLVWDASASTIEGLGINLSKVEQGDFGVSYAASNLPKTLSDVSTVFLSVGHDDRLWRVVAVSRDFERDGYGTAVRSRYDELKATLAARYGSPKEFESLSSDDYYRQPDNFIYGIYSNENYWGAAFETLELRLELSIDASGTSDSYWRVVYVNKAGETAFEAQHTDVEADVL